MQILNFLGEYCTQNKRDSVKLLKASGRPFITDPNSHVRKNKNFKIGNSFNFKIFLVAYLNLGSSLIALGRHQEAAQILREGSRLDGTGLRDRREHEHARISSLLVLGQLLTDHGRLQRAIAVYREALATLPVNFPRTTSKVRK